MARAEKVAAVAELSERFQTSAGAVLTEYRGLTVAQLGDLRRSLGDHATFSVVKNTLTKIAAADAGVAGDLTEMLSGPSAIAFVSGDVVEAAKGLRDFSRTHPFLVIKGGVLDGKMLTPAEIVKLADLESREVLLAKLAGAMKATMSGAAATFAALPVQMARLLAALEEKRSAEAPSTDAAGTQAAGAEAPGADGAAAEGPSAEGPSTEAPGAEALGADGAAAEGPSAEAPGAEGPSAEAAAVTEPAAAEEDAAGERKDG
jgi:large subunit ribosomal protein L10